MVLVTAINSTLLIGIIAKSLSVSADIKQKKSFFDFKKNGQNIYAKNTSLKVLNFCLVKTVKEQTLDQSHWNFNAGKSLFYHKITRMTISVVNHFLLNFRFALNIQSFFANFSSKHELFTANLIEAKVFFGFLINYRSFSYYLSFS